MEFFAFVLVEHQNEKDCVAHEKYFRMLSEIDFIDFYFHRAGISAELHLSSNIPRPSFATFHRQDRIDICFTEKPFFENLPRKGFHIASLKSEVFK